MIKLLFSLFVSFPALSFDQNVVVSSKSISEITLKEIQEWKKTLFSFSDSENSASEGKSTSFTIHSKFILEELKASLSEVHQEFVSGVHSDSSFSCRFPARSKFIQKVFFNPRKLDFSNCENYMFFLNETPIDSLKVVFADYNPSLPTSAFGHVFLRIDSATKEKNKDKLLSSIVDFGADTTGHSMPGYFAGSIFGFTKGRFGWDRYHKKILMYSEHENRDLWEHQVDLSPDELSRLIDILFEQRDNYFDYYFFSKNCAYYIAALIQAAAPRLEIIGRTNIWVHPIDIVVLLQSQKAISHILYRPSRYTKLIKEYEQMSVPLQKYFNRHKKNHHLLIMPYSAKTKT